jgi:DnaD/phage-associated family protein
VADHQFSVEVAVEYGINAAVLFQNIAYWCEHSEANEKHFHDGRYWMYNSIGAFRKLFPYFTEKQIRSAIEKLISCGLILKGNYNTRPYDRTMWYSLTEKGKAMRCAGANGFAPEGEWNCPGGQMDLPHRSNGFAPEGEPIPDSNPDSNHTDENPMGYEEEDEESARAGEINPFAGDDGRRPGFDTVYAYASGELQALGARAMEEIGSFVDDLSEDIVRHAIDNALDGGVRTWNYVKSILNRYVDEGVKSVGDAKASDEKFMSRRKKGGGDDNAGQRTRDEQRARDDAFLDGVFKSMLI